ncbi:MAG: DUF120 domain-containing protein [Nitrosopumilus sp.]|nr:DUF120 domain-containing protein [Nitrosopumilus sp.]
MKAQHVRTIARLLAMGAGSDHVDVSTSGLGRSLGMSQQAASRHLVDLADEGLVERAPGGRSVRVTPLGISEVERLHAELGAGLGRARRVDLAGSLVSGMGEGAYYMSLGGYTGQFREKLGYVPYPGTLNVRLDGPGRRAASLLAGLPSTHIDGFSDGSRTFGPVSCLAAETAGIRSHLVLPERTHHDGSVIEIIAPVCLREEASLSDGSRVEVRVLP